jgi:hypothetical protein
LRIFKIAQPLARIHLILFPEKIPSTDQKSNSKPGRDERLDLIRVQDALRVSKGGQPDVMFSAIDDLFAEGRRRKGTESRARRISATAAAEPR